MTDELKKQVDKVLGRIFEVPEGAHILNEGEVNLDMYKILSGHAEVYIGYGTSRETLIGLIGPQACFGEFGLLLQKPALYTVVAYSDMTLIRITEGDIGDFVQANHRNIIAIMRNMAQTMLVMKKQIDMLLEDIEKGEKPDDETLHSLEKTIGNYAAGQSMKEGKMYYLTSERMSRL